MAFFAQEAKRPLCSLNVGNLYRFKVDHIHFFYHTRGFNEIVFSQILKCGESMKALVIEDDVKISRFIVSGLDEAGIKADSAGDGAEGISLAHSNKYDVIILDIMLPKIDGFEVIAKLRELRLTTPILIVSAKRSLEERVFGLQIGGDDYIVKPFAFAELLARVNALVRRSATPKSEPTQVSVGDLRIDLLTREVRRCEKKIDLQVKEFSLLEYFLRNEGSVITKAQILEKIWNYNFDPQTNVVDVLVWRLRSKIDKDFDFKCIQTVRGIGYVFKNP